MKDRNYSLRKAFSTFAYIIIMCICAALPAMAEEAIFAPAYYYDKESEKIVPVDNEQQFEITDENGYLIVFDIFQTTEQAELYYRVTGVNQGEGNSLILELEGEDQLIFYPSEEKIIHRTRLPQLGYSSDMVYTGFRDFKQNFEKVRKMAKIPSGNAFAEYSLDPFLGRNVFFSPVLLLENYCGIIPYDEFSFGEEYVQLNATRRSYSHKLEPVSAYGPSDVRLICDSPVLKSLPEVHPSSVHVTISNDTWYGCKSYEICNRNASYTFFLHSDKKKAKKFYSAMRKELENGGVNVIEGDRKKAHDGVKEICYGTSPQKNYSWQLKMTEVVGDYLVTLTIFRPILKK